MNRNQLSAFLSVADHLHFGRAARDLGVLPATLSRDIKALEQDLGLALFTRTTRHVGLTPAGDALLPSARETLGQLEFFRAKAQSLAATLQLPLRVGVIDSAAAGLIPPLLQHLRESHPEIAVQIIEEKTVRLIPRLLSGALDLAILRPPPNLDRRLVVHPIAKETAVVALPETHALAAKSEISVQDLADVPMIVPDRASRPHSHDLTLRLFQSAGLPARLNLIAGEKHTILHLVATGAGLAIVPRWSGRLAVPGVTIRPLAGDPPRLGLAAAWPAQVKDPRRDAFWECLELNLTDLTATA